MRDEPRSLPDTVARLRQLRSSFDLDQEYRYALFDREEQLNTSSSRVPEKLGFTHEATLGRRGVDGNGNEHDLMIRTLFADRYAGSPSSTYDVRGYDAVGDRVL